MTYSKDSKIIIVGAGVFGLSNALHLAQNGYTDITVYDRLDLIESKYSLLNGTDTLSADINKIFRIQYGDKVHYQRLAIEAGEFFEQWDRELKLLPDEEAKNYTGLQILDRCGALRLEDIEGNSPEERRNLAAAESEGLRSLQFDINNPDDVRRAKVAGWGSKLNPVKLLERGKVKHLSGVLDSTTGILYASRACFYVNYLCRNLGVKFVLGGDKGTLKEVIYENGTEAKGIITLDGVSHPADLVVICAGPWTTSLVPELDGINEGTQGNVVIFKIPEDRKDLQEKYCGRNFPVLDWRMGHSREKDYMSGLFIFPAMEPEGYMKVISRQTKYTNPVKTEDGRVVSIPTTRNSDPPTNLIPKHTLEQIKDFLIIFFPDLVEAGIKLESRMLWYTDTINNDYIYDFVPGKKNLFVACGGSGHAFKMLPVLGRFLVNKIEGEENFYTKLFKWRDPKDFKNDVNGLKEGLNSKRIYTKQEISTEKDLVFENIEDKIKNLTIEPTEGNNEYLSE